MSFANNDDRNEFINYLGNCIWASQFNCFAACPKGYIPQEPDFIAFLVRDLAFYIPIILKSKFNITNCTTQGVFCHQSPKVKFSNPNPNQRDGAELGDLLIVYTETQNQILTSRALLLQAKCVSSIPHTIGSNEQHQLYLYQKWPDFEYSSPLELIRLIEILKNNNKQSLKPHRQVNIKHKEQLITDYLLLPKPTSKVITHGYVIAPPDNQLYCKCALSTTIGKMLNLDEVSDLKSGSSFELIPNYDPSKNSIPDDDWSNMINDIIYIGNKHFNRRRSGFIDQKRIFCFEYNASGIFSGDDINLSANGDGIQNNMPDDEENAGVSTLMINVNIID